MFQSFYIFRASFGIRITTNDNILKINATLALEEQETLVNMGNISLDLINDWVLFLITPHITLLVKSA